MSIISNIEPPEGMEAYLDGETIRFRPKSPVPATLLKVEHKVLNAKNQQVLFESWNVNQWRWETGDRNSYHLGRLLRGEGDPLRRNPHSFRRFEITIAHPNEEWVKTAADLLVDYLDFHLGAITADEMP